MCHFLKQFLDGTKHKGTLHFTQYMGVFTLSPESLHKAQTLLPLAASDPKYSGKHCSTAVVADVDGSGAHGEEAGPSGACDEEVGASGACDEEAGASGASEVLDCLASSDTSLSLNSFWVRGLLF